MLNTINDIGQFTIQCSKPLNGNSSQVYSNFCLTILFPSSESISRLAYGISASKTLPLIAINSADIVCIFFAFTRHAMTFPFAVLA